MIKHLIFLAMFASASALAEEVESDLEAEQKMLRTSFDILDANDDGVIDVVEAAVDEELDEAFATIAREGKLNPKGYFEWRIGQGRERTI